MKYILSVILLVFGGLNLTESEDDLVTIRVIITNVENDDSKIMIAVFSHYTTFLTEEMYRQQIIAVSDYTETVVEFKVAKGEYAIAIFQDMNKNGDLDRNIFSYPSEPFGFSNNYRPLVKPPHWTDVAFQVEGEKTIEVNLR
ncbi:MAG: hypothetical protein ACI9CP_001495 [Cryomorphaceae bacterium]|jgi:uncharacterized protein (DUF2141 family)